MMTALAALYCLSVPAIASAASQSGTTSEAVVKQRAQERWGLLIEGRLESAYEYLSPGYRAAHSLADYSRSIRGGIWNAADVSKVDCEARRCEIQVIVHLIVDKSGKPVPVPIQETWIRVEPGDDWWHVPLPAR